MAIYLLLLPNKQYIFVYAALKLILLQIEA